MGAVSCPKCRESYVLKYEYGGYWCPNCHNWCTTREYSQMSGRLKISISEEIMR